MSPSSPNRPVATIRPGIVDLSTSLLGLFALIEAKDRAVQRHASTAAMDKSPTFSPNRPYSAAAGVGARRVARLASNFSDSIVPRPGSDHGHTSMQIAQPWTIEK